MRPLLREGEKPASLLANRRLGIAVRALAAILGGYVLTSLIVAGLSLVLPMSRAEAVLTSSLLSFLIYACLALWVFSARMQESLRQSMSWLHTWSGLVVGWILFAIFLTGTLSYFKHEISQWMRPEMFGVRAEHSAAAVRQSAVVAWEEMRRRAPQSPDWFIDLPGERNPLIRAGWYDPKPGAPRRGFKNESLDPTTGQTVGARDTRGGEFFYRFHFELGMKPLWGRWIVGFAAMFMLVAIVSGVITHKKIFKDFFTFRPRKGQRSWLDGHNAVGVLALPFHVLITYTGLVTLLFMYMPWGVKAAYGEDRPGFLAEALAFKPAVEASGERATITNLEPLLEEAARRWNGAAPTRIAVNNQGDANATVELFNEDTGRISNHSGMILFDGVSGKVLSERGEVIPPAATTYNVLYGLHIAEFSGTALRWLFFFSGMTGTLMVATGLVLWTVKRAPERAKLGYVPFGHRLVESLNIGAVVGLPIAIAAFFWANRLLPVELAGRSSWETRTFFLAWIIAIVFAFRLRPARRAWRKLLWAASALFVLLPIVNALTTRTHLGISLAQGEWVFAGFDLAALFMGLVAGWLAWKIGVYRSPQRARRSATVAQAEVASDEGSLSPQPAMAQTSS